MPRKSKARREPTPKQEGEQILEAAAKAGADYAHEQVGGDYFRDWVYDQMLEAEGMRKRDPSSVVPLETPADAKKVARSMLQQLEWDTKRQLDQREILELSGATGVFGAGSEDWVKDKYGIAVQDVTGAFFEAFDEALRSTGVREWLTDLVLQTKEDMGGGATVGEARRQPGMTPEQRDSVVEALRHYGADLTDDDFIRKGEKALGVRVEVRKGRLRMARADGSALASYPATNIGTGVADFVESFWFWKPVNVASETVRRQGRPMRRVASRSYPYDKSPSGQYVLTRDGREIIRGTESEIWRWMHSNLSYSVDHALQHEGYKISPVERRQVGRGLGLPARRL